MAPRTSRTWMAGLALALLAPAAVIAACSSSGDNPSPTTPIYQVGNEGGAATGEDSGSSSGSSSGSQPDDASSAHDAPLTELDGALVLDAAVCTTDAGCWSCTPNSTPEFLNQCTASACSPFQNALRLPNYDGGLPPLN